MDKTEETKSFVNHARQLIEQSESNAIKQYGSVVVAAEELLKSSRQSGQYIDEFLKEANSVHTGQDTLLLVCLGMVTKIGFEGDKTSSMPELNDSNYGFILSEYHPIKRAANNIRAAELFPEQDEIIMPVVQNAPEDMFQDYVGLLIGRFYKAGMLWKQKLMWQLLKEWNSNGAKAGIPGSVRSKLGEDKALELFRNTANSIMDDRELLSKAVEDYHKANPYANK